MTATEGNGNDIRAQLREARSKAKLASAKIQLRRLERTQMMLESFSSADWVATYANSLDRFRNPDNFQFNISTVNDRRYGRNFPIFQNEQELGLFRMQARILTSTNSYAIGLLEGLTGYVIGDGFQYRAVAARRQNPPQELLDAVQDIIDDFHERNEWFGGEQPGLEEELFWRSCEDGEFLISHHADPCDAAHTTLRTIEPEQLTQSGSPWSWEEASFGIKTPIDDAQHVEAYWIFFGASPNDGEEFSPDEVTHFRRNVKRSIKRGLTDFCFDTADAFEMASKLRRNMTTGAAIQAAIAGVREHATATAAQVTDFTQAIADYTRMDQVTGRSQNVTKYDVGQWVDIPASMKYVQPPGAANAQAHIEVPAGLPPRRRRALERTRVAWLRPARHQQLRQLAHCREPFRQEGQPAPEGLQVPIRAHVLGGPGAVFQG